MDMNNNDILIRLRYALDIKNTDMLEIFKLGGVEVTREELAELLTKTTDRERDNEGELELEDEESNECSDFMLETFLNGLIIFKRGRQEPKPGQPERPPMSIKKHSSVNNVMLKKVKIALALTSEDVMDILESTGVIIRKSELSAFFRKEGHFNYVECGDKYARNFLKGLALRYRK
ncbi:DUF1456 family protein [Falsibacillus pallidus]|uniref:Uncharacterized protein YehS (DUF1456 family) n=1 Tax=Falsibacillus pallidus TaxID=493781 RepID=A0A370G5V0_9BACI|nr:DUF1456 family protein [Falsibacillus pallidus]RDI39182.1 uncharacterized protein YehS (DUF1456 family) [Falsibacillus pallidus]